MAAFLYLASPGEPDRPAPGTPNLLLESSPEYWFLYRYFEAANLDRRHELIDLYGGGVIEGYQLYRLRFELEQALIDVATKQDEWAVLVGWTGEKPSIDSEDWRQVTKCSVTAVVQSMLSMIECARIGELKLVTRGD
jgi:hypothetical protein